MKRVAVVIIALAACTGGSGRLPAQGGASIASIGPLATTGVSATLPSVPIRPASPPTEPSSSETTSANRERGQLPGIEGAKSIDHGQIVYGMVDANGWLLGIPAPTPPSEDQPCGSPLMLRSPDGTTTPGPQDSLGRCISGTDTNPVGLDFVAFVESATGELALHAGWKLRVYNRHTKDTWIVAPVSEGLPDQPLIYPSLSGHWLVWSELRAVPALTGSDTTSYIANLDTRRVTTLGTGLSSPIVHWPFVYANRFTTDVRHGSLVKIDLRSQVETSMGVGDVQWMAANDDAIVASTSDGAVVIAPSGATVLRLPYHIYYPVAAEHLVVWLTYPSSGAVQRVVLDTTCLAIYDVGAPTTQGVAITTAGPYISWNDWPNDEVPLNATTMKLHIVDTRSLSLC